MGTNNNNSISSLFDSTKVFINLNIKYYFLKPVPAGINFPTITFSFNPNNLSFFSLIAASVKTFVVSWNDAADINDSVVKDALVIPNKTCLYLISFYFQTIFFINFF